MTAAIETSALTKTFGRVRAVVDLDLRVETAEVFGFLGPNGAGKTTTIRMLLALHRPTSGRAAVLGLDSAADSIAIHRRTGYPPGELAPCPRMTGQRHIGWFARARGVADLSLARELAERFRAVLDRPAHEVSTGNRQKIGLILAFMARPELLVLDEPTTGLDPLIQNEFERLVREVAAEGRTVFLSSHELDEVQRLASRVAIIKDGRLITTRTVDALRASAPRTMQVTFRQPVDPAAFGGLAGNDRHRQRRVAAGSGGHRADRPPAPPDRRPRPGRPDLPARRPGRAVPRLLPRIPRTGVVACALTSPGSTCPPAAAASPATRSAWPRTRSSSSPCTRRSRTPAPWTS